jgi:hypothetical protein
MKAGRGEEFLREHNTQLPTHTPPRPNVHVRDWESRRGILRGVCVPCRRSGSAERRRARWKRPRRRRSGARIDEHAALWSRCRGDRWSDGCLRGCWVRGGARWREVKGKVFRSPRLRRLRPAKPMAGVTKKHGGERRRGRRRWRTQFERATQMAFDAVLHVTPPAGRSSLWVRPHATIWLVAAAGRSDRAEGERRRVPLLATSLLLGVPPCFT